MVELTIIIPVYNAEKYIRKCIDSILNQTYQDYELLLIDDGSSDNSLLICKEYERKDNRIKVFHQQNAGPSSARNLGINLAQGTYMSFIDADDYIKPNMFSELIQLIENSKCDLVLSPITREFLYYKSKRFLTPTLAYVGKVYNSKEDSHKIFSLFDKAIINSPCARIYKTQIIKENHIIMPNEIHNGEDLIFNIDYLRYCESIYISNQSYYFYTRRKSGSLTTSYVHQLFQLNNLKHDKVLDYLCGSLNINEELEHNAYYFTVNNIIGSIFNLFYDDCPLTRSEKISYIHSMIHDRTVMEKINKAHKPGFRPKLYKLFLKTKYTIVIYYTCKFYRYVRNYTLELKDLGRRTS